MVLDLAHSSLKKGGNSVLMSFIPSAQSISQLSGISKVSVSLYFSSMSQKKTDQLYNSYRNIPDLAPSLTQLLEKLDQSADNPRSHFELGEAAYQAGLLQLSVECFFKVTELAPQVEAGFFNLGNAYFDLKDFENAKQAYERAFHLNPEAGTLNNIGNSYAAMADWRNAIQTFERALSLGGGGPVQIRTARSNLGKALLAALDMDGAINNYREAILQFPRDIEFLSLLANCHHQKFEFGKAAECLAKGLDVSQNNPELLCQIANVNFCRGRTLESLLCMNQAFSIASPPARLQSRRLQMLAFCEPATPQRLLRETTEWANALHSQPDSAGIVSPKTNPLRVGILCHTLTTRGLIDWLPDCLGKCDPLKVQWTLFCDTPVSAEAMGKFAQAGCRLERTPRLSDKELTSLIETQQIDLLIDMIGHGFSTRLPTIAKKPAHIQVAWCSFPMTSGLSQLDYIWSDPVAIPVESEKFISERVVRFPNSSFCFQPIHSLNLQVQDEFSETRFRCGFLGQPEQLSEPLIETMQSILVSVSDSELVFIGNSYRDPAFQIEICQKFENFRELSSRLRFEIYESIEDELGSYQNLDVTLDAFFVSSPQRSFESLWMGVPVVTLIDERLSGRSTASILMTLHRNDWIATNQNEYCNAVKQIADSRSAWRAKRALLREELLASPMCDTTLISRNIEQAIDETLRQFQLANTP